MTLNSDLGEPAVAQAGQDAARKVDGRHFGREYLDEKIERLAHLDVPPARVGGGEGSLPPAESAGEGSMGARTSSALSGAVMAAESAGSSPSAMVRARLGRVSIVRTRSADVVSGRKKRLISRRVGILAGGR